MMQIGITWLEKYLVTRNVLTAARAIPSPLTTIAVLNKFAPERIAPPVARLFTTPRRRARSVNDEAILATSTPFDLLEGIAAMRWGDPNAPKVLLVHGWESRASHFGVLIKALTEAGRSVIAFDGPGHGDSQGDSANVYLFAKTILAMKNKLGKVDTVIGHSMGAASATYALAHGFEADALVHMAGPGRLRDVLGRFCDRINLSRESRDVFFPYFERLLGTKVDELDNPKWVQQLTIPALFIHDPQDPEVPFSEGAAVAESLKGSVIYRAEGMGHTRILRAKEIVDLITKFVINKSL
jgi:pimeloyl-ACP methyl ester carboxylesterase